ncbi:EH domain-containing protein 2-like [Silurus asotus]|uniref:EH domain-containing protein 2-like n=1 Tax=Silurus asotus TaxID=30991 RepID=A0AAD5A1X4_SILAS|nr:EH domain-containing protein 2-like [Silurus asotus]
MASRKVKNRGVKSLKEVRTVTEGLKFLYRQKLLPLEKHYSFADFHSPSLEDADFDNKPMILVVGQCSTGKTTFIRYLLEQDYPGGRTGPEPTTDCFTAIMHSDVDGVVPGNALVMDPKKPFRKLNYFGTTFLNRFQCVHFPNQVLESLSIIDTPGILSSTKKRMSRGSYDFPAVLRWFAEHVDLIILLCDAHKLELSDEFSRSIIALRGHEDKLRVLLNKADMVDSQQLMRVYGGLMWSLGKVICTPEVLRVYIGSFWSSPFRTSENRVLFEREEEDLFNEIQNLPRNSALRKLNDLVKRARLARTHAYIISFLKEKMPLFHRDNKKRDLIYDLPVVFSSLQQRHRISAGDFPDCAKMQKRLMDHDFTKFKTLKPKFIAGLEELLTNDIAKLMPLLHQEELAAAEQPGVQGGPLVGVKRGPFFEGNPFYYSGPNKECEENLTKEAWVVYKEKPKYDEIFYNLSPQDGKLSGMKVKDWMISTQLPNSVLSRIWKLSDVDGDGMLDDEEFALASHLIEVKLEGFGLPSKLPADLVPPSKRRRKASSTENREDCGGV